jgi:hypothetical protein
MDCFASLAMTTSLFASKSAVVIREGGMIQYSETSAIEPRSRSVLDTPHARGMTTSECIGRLGRQRGKIQSAA